MSNFNNYYSHNTKIYCCEIDEDQVTTLLNQQLIYFGHYGNGKVNWKRFRESDLVIFHNENTGHWLYSAVILQKKIVIDYFTPFVIKVKLVGYCNVNFGNAEEFVEDIDKSLHSFKQAWNICINDESGLPVESQVAGFEVKLNEEYSFKIACSEEDFNFIGEISRNHKFGGSSYFCSFILLKNDEKVAAALVSYSAEDSRQFSKSKLIFGKNESAIKNNALFVKRLLTKEDIDNKNTAHQHLLQVIIDYSELFFPDGCSLVEGVSYDYNISAYRLGFNVLPPQRISDVYYYWRPGKTFNLDDVQDKVLDKEDLSSYTHRNINEKGRVNSWLIKTEPEDFSENQFKLYSHERNADKFGNLIKVSDILFFDTGNELFYTTVVNKENTFDDNRNRKHYILSLSNSSNVHVDDYVLQVLKDNPDRIILLENGFSDYLINNNAEVIVTENSHIAKKYAFWGINIRRNRFDLIRQFKAWFLKGYIDNRVSWKKVKANDIAAFFENNAIIGFAKIKGRHEDKDSLDKGGFPLIIDFSSLYILKSPIYIKNSAETFWMSQRVGIFSIPTDFVDDKLVNLINLNTIIKNMDNVFTKGEMIVKPNPFFIRNNNYEVKPKQIFLVISFSLLDNIKQIITNILEPDGYTIVSAKEQDGQVLFQDIWDLLNQSEIVIVDFTGKRPNVYLEFGMAIVLGKPIIAITQNEKDIPSDVTNIKYIVYKDKLGDTTLQVALRKKIVDTLMQFERH